MSNSDLNDGNNILEITIQNRSGINFNSCYIKPSSAEDWGLSFGSLSNNGNLSITLPIPPGNCTVFDIQMKTTDPTVPSTFTKSNVPITNGMVVTFISTDADGPNNNLPVIVIQNNTSQNFYHGWRKPSASTGWGSNIVGYAGISSGQSGTVSLPYLLSTQSVYDFRFKPSSGDNRFIKYSVSASNGMILIFTNSDLE